MANNDGEGLVGAPAVARFVDRLEELSGDRLTVRVESRWQGGTDEARVIKDVGAGRADLGWSGTRAFDRAGVDDFQPLHAPFLIRSYAGQAAIVKDPLGRELLGSLRPLGLTGLALAADQMRFPAGIEKPLLTPADFKGLRLRTTLSDVQWDGVRALGAQPTADNLETPEEPLGGVETMWWTYQSNGQFKVAPFVTANALLWPRTVAVFAHTGTLDKLSAQERAWITRAAAEASDWSTRHAADKEAGQLRDACAGGARIAMATPAQLTALRSAAEPVYASLRAQPALAPILTRVQKLAGAQAPSTPEVPADCAYQPGDKNPSPPPSEKAVGPGRPGDLPQGTYRYRNSVAELQDLGMTEHDARMNAGVFTWNLRDGAWNYRQEPVDSSVQNTTCEGWYDVRGDTAVFTASTTLAFGACAPPTWAARWKSGDGKLTWSGVGGDFGPVFEGKPWQRVG
jgi:TRAP-type C4-dicarboxylate transport system substrate-binding protein